MVRIPNIPIDGAVAAAGLRRASLKSAATAAANRASFVASTPMHMQTGTSHKRPGISRRVEYEQAPKQRVERLIAHRKGILQVELRHQMIGENREELLVYFPAKDPDAQEADAENRRRAAQHHPPGAAESKVAE